MNSSLIWLPDWTLATLISVLCGFLQSLQANSKTSAISQLCLVSNSFQFISHSAILMLCNQWYWERCKINLAYRDISTTAAHLLVYSEVTYTPSKVLSRGSACPIHVDSNIIQIHNSPAQLQRPIDIEKLIGSLRCCEREAGTHLAVVDLELYTLQQDVKSTCIKLPLHI
jgi:hypothetical protein